jgi:NAD(P)H-dependent FMN reductase
MISKALFKKLFLHIFILAMIIFYSCGGLTSQSVALENRTRIFSNSYTDVFKAIVDFCNREGFAIQTVDKELGILQTDYKSSGGIMTEGRIKLNFTLSKFEENQTKVVLIAVIEEQDKRGNWHADQSLTGAWEDVYKIIFDSVSKTL